MDDFQINITDTDITFRAHNLNYHFSIFQKEDENLRIEINEAISKFTDASNVEKYLQEKGYKIKFVSIS